jgi:hypothetical protein
MPEGSQASKPYLLLQSNEDENGIVGDDR